MYKACRPNPNKSLESNCQAVKSPGGWYLRRYNFIMNEQIKHIIVNPAQDFVEGAAYYTIQFKNENYIVNSKGDIVPFSGCWAKGIQLTTYEVNRSQLSAECLKSFVSGNGNLDVVQLYNDLNHYLQSYIYLKDKRFYTLLTLWSIGTYVFRIFRYYPYIHLNAEKGSGKTTLMEILLPICFNGDLSTDSTAAAQCEEIHNNSSTIFQDEVENLTSGHSNLNMRILKSGFSKSGRINRKSRFYSTYSPKMFAGINSIDDVLSDRMITIPMIKKLPDEPVKYYYLNEEIKKRQSEMVDKLYMFGLKCSYKISEIYENGLPVLEHLKNRAWDLWAPILSIAKAIDGENGIYSEMVELSKDVTEEKAEFDETENETTRYLNTLLQMIDKLEPLKVDGTTNYFDANQVFAYFSIRGYLPINSTRTTLSRTLRRKFGIRCLPSKLNGMLKRMYVISSDTVRDYVERYLPT
jgi:hypothetical protein